MLTTAAQRAVSGAGMRVLTGGGPDLVSNQGIITGATAAGLDLYKGGSLPTAASRRPYRAAAMG